MVHFIILLISVIRILVGVVLFVAGKLSMKLMKFPVDQQATSTLVMTRMFGIRDLGLGTLTLFCMDQTALVLPLLIINLCMDLGDVIAFFGAYKTDSTMKPSAISSGGVALLAVMGWVIALTLVLV